MRRNSLKLIYNIFMKYSMKIYFANHFLLCSNMWHDLIVAFSRKWDMMVDGYVSCLFILLCSYHVIFYADNKAS